LTAKVWKYFCRALGIAGIARAVRLSILSWGQPWPDPILTIDGKSYLKGAAGATWGTLLEVHDLYHSPGYQLYLRAIFATFGSISALIDASRIFSLLMFLGSAVLLYRLGRRWFHPPVAQLAVAIFLCSESWTYYCNMIQYEVLTGFLILIVISLLTRGQPSESPTFRGLKSIAIGTLLAFITVAQMRYVALLVIPLICAALIWRTELSDRSRQRGRLALVTAVVLLATWSVAQTHIQGRIIFLMDGSGFRFDVANNPNAMGYSFPYPEIIEPSGWQFVLAMPGQWLWLIGQRALYLSGIQRDIWALPPKGFRSGPIGSLSSLDIISTIVFAVGLFLAGWRIYRRELSKELILPMLALACMIMPPLLIFGSKRFIVPVIPFIALFQGYAIFETAIAGGRQIGHFKTVGA
jgi:hypothetical protein